MPVNPWKLHSQNREYDEPFHLTTTEGEMIVGKFTDPESPNQPFGHVLVARGDGGLDYRWVFNKALDKVTRGIILKGLKNDPDFRGQFVKPVDLVKIESKTIEEAVQAAFGEHIILEPGSASPTVHSWEQATSVVLTEKPPKLFMDFLNKSSLMKLTKAKGGFHLRVTAAHGHACEANKIFLTVLSDFVKGELLAPKAYKYEIKIINTMPNKPVLPQSKKPKAQIDVTDSIRMINSAHGEAATKLIAMLKVGRDEFTAMRGDTLKGMQDPEDLKLILKKYWIGTKYESKKSVSQASQCMRWRLRGLSLEQSMQKVELDVKSNEFFAERSTSLKSFD